jgi:hypothetical protein
MVYIIPTLSRIDRDVVGLIEDQWRQLRRDLGQSPMRWGGFLRRNAFVRALQGSNSVKDYDASMDGSATIMGDEPPETVPGETF